MTMEQKILLHLQFLVRVVRKECKHLSTTDQSLFGSPFTLEQATRPEEDPVVLSSALQTGHAFVPALIAAANKMITEIARRGWA